MEFDALQALTKGPLSSSISKLSDSSRFLLNSKDFHEFKVPIEQITKESQTMHQDRFSFHLFCFPDAPGSRSKSEKQEAKKQLQRNPYAVIGLNRNSTD
ncbi:hypothetical protein ACFX1X_005140 [Malus domestica]